MTFCGLTFRLNVIFVMNTAILWLNPQPRFARPIFNQLFSTLLHNDLPYLKLYNKLSKILKMCKFWCNKLLFWLSSVCKGGTGEKERTPISHESFLLMANSQTDVDDWVKAIRRVIWAPFGGGELKHELLSHLLRVAQYRNGWRTVGLE